MSDKGRTSFDALAHDIISRNDRRSKPNPVNPREQAEAARAAQIESTRALQLKEQIQRLGAEACKTLIEHGCEPRLNGFGSVSEGLATERYALGLRTRQANKPVPLWIVTKDVIPRQAAHWPSMAHTDDSISTHVANYELSTPAIPPHYRGLALSKQGNTYAYVTQPALGAHSLEYPGSPYIKYVTQDFIREARLSPDVLYESLASLVRREIEFISGSGTNKPIHAVDEYKIVP